MDLKEYQKWTITTAIYPGAGEHGFNEAIYLTLGLGNEAGEFSGKVKKIIRGDTVHPYDLVSEMGDVLWYLTRLCDNMKITLEDLADINYQKLSKRMETDTIKGNGDYREQEVPSTLIQMP